MEYRRQVFGKDYDSEMSDTFRFGQTPAPAPPPVTAQSLGQYGTSQLQSVVSAPPGTTYETFRSKIYELCTTGRTNARYAPFVSETICPTLAFTVFGATDTIPICLLSPRISLYRGTPTTCRASSKTYNFDKSVWFTWQRETAQAYAHPSGCVVQYSPPASGIRLLDFWDWRVMSIILWCIHLGKLTPPEIASFQLYTGFGLGKAHRRLPDGGSESSLLRYAAQAKLLDDSMLPGTPFYKDTRVNVPNQYDEKRGIAYGSEIYDFDHSSTRILDQLFGSILAKIFGGVCDGVAVRFGVPSSMHKNSIHAELFMFPGKAMKLVHATCRDPGMTDGQVCPIGAGKRKTRTRKQKKKSRRRRSIRYVV